MKPTFEELKSRLASLSSEASKLKALAASVEAEAEEALSLACSLSVEAASDELIKKYEAQKVNQN